MKDDALPIVHLRAMEPEDLDTLYRIENDQQLWNVGTTNVPYSRYTLHDYIASSSGDIYIDRQVRLIIENASNQIVGIVDVTNFDPRHRRAEIGIVIEKPYRQCGYARSALCGMHNYASRVLHLHQVYAVIDATNHEALSLFHDMGYRHTAVLEDWLYDGVSYNNAQLMQLKLL